MDANRRTRTSIVLADDHPIVRKGMVDLLAEGPDLEVVASCADGREALEAVEEFRPDVAVLDLRMPELSGLDVLAAISERELDARVVMLTVSIDDVTLLQAVRRGLNGLLLKDAVPEELVRCIREVAAGRRYLPDATLRGAMAREQDRQEATGQLFGRLTERERQIAAFVAEGLSNKAIASRLDISDGTVKVHLHRMYQKLKVTNRSALAAMAVSHARDLADLAGAGSKGPTSGAAADGPGSLSSG